MEILGKLLMGSAILICAASMVIVAGKVYLGEGPQGVYQEVQEITIPASEYTGE